MQKKEESGSVKSVLKALGALDFVLEQSMTRPGVGLSEIAAALAIPADHGAEYPENHGAGRLHRPRRRPALRAGAEMPRGMSRGARVSARLMKVMPPVLERLAADLGESFVVTTLFNGMRKVLLRQQGSSPIVVETRNAEQDAMAYRLVTTRIMLAFTSENELDLFIGQNGLPGREWDGIDSRDGLEARLRQLKLAGYAEDEIPAGIYAAAFPLLDGTGMMLGALGLFLPSFRLTAGEKSRIFAMLHETLLTLQERL